MSTTNDTKTPRRNYACLAQYYEPDAPPTAVVYRDENGPLIRTSPFGSNGLMMSITIERWRQWNAIVEQAIAESVSLHLSGASL
ncbi:hypothetical protein [Mycobacterium sp. TY813]|uniref:hypothetical protein n=1 Tax=Mycobacterium TaxID=1763 RepID=UPI002741A454|nr:hypothetical protein [Mycobacterium sp. TY813]MDP7729546.1 hypothetical protein [Mycobacterium sp. TY813]